MHSPAGPQRDDDLLDALLEQLETLAEQVPAATFEELVAADPELRAKFDNDPALGREVAAQFAALRSINTLIASSHQDAVSLPTVPGYLAVELVGHGGAGVVYRAQQLSLGREVALKLMLGGRFASQRARDRFRAEAKTAAQLQHPNIAQIYDHGEFEQLPFLSQEFVRGGSLAERICRAPITARVAAQLVEKLARAAHYAHQLGIVHRDLKPGNVLLTETGEPKIIDFGLARGGDFDSHLTRQNETPGTPSYMAPEQVQGALSTPATDVYGLGAILYELLAGRPPFEGASVAEIHGKVLAAPATFEAHIVRRVSAELRAIAQKCLEKNPQLRYANARALADDLQRWQEGIPTQAQPLGPVVRMVRWARRRPASAALIAVSLLATTALLVGSIYYSIRVTGALRLAEQHRLEAVHRQAEVERKERELSRHLYAADVPLALKAYQRKNIAQARRLLSRHVPQPGRSDLRSFAWYLLDHMCHAERICLRGHKGDVYTATYSPNGRLLATCGYDGSVRIWDSQDGRLLATALGHQGELSCLAFSNDGKLLASGDNEGVVRVWNVDVLLIEGSATGSHSRPSAALLELRLPQRECIWSVAFAPSDDRLAVGSQISLDIYNLKQGELVRHWEMPVREVKSILFPQGENDVVFVSHLGIYHGDLRTGAVTAFPVLHEHTLTALAVAPDSNLLASADSHGAIKLWNWRTAENLECGIPQIDRVDGLDFSPDGNLLAVAGKDRAVELWDLKTRKLSLRLLGSTAAVWSTEFSPDGSEIVAACADGSVRIWRAQSTHERHLASAVGVDYTSVAFAPDAKTLAAGTADGRIEIWDWEGRQLAPGEPFKSPIRPGAEHLTAIRGIAYISDQEIATLNQGGWVEFWDLPNRRLREATAILPAGSSLCVSPDGKYLLAANAPHCARIWDRSRREWLPLATALGDVSIGAMSADGQLLGVRYAGGLAMRTLGIAKQQTERSWRIPAEVCVGFTISPGGEWAASGGNHIDRAVHLWDIRSGRECASLVGHGNAVTALAFHRDGRTLASSGADGTLRIWNLYSQQEMLAFETSYEHTLQLAFSPDGRALVLIGGRESEPGELCVWSVSPGIVPQATPISLSDSAELSSTRESTSLMVAADRESDTVAQNYAFASYVDTYTNVHARSQIPLAPPLLVTFEERCVQGELQVACVHLPKSTFTQVTVPGGGGTASLATALRALEATAVPVFCYAAHNFGSLVHGVCPPPEAIEFRDLTAAELQPAEDLFERHRQVHRWAKAHGFVGGWPTFQDRLVEGQQHWHVALIKPGCGREIWVPVGGPPRPVKTDAPTE